MQTLFKMYKETDSYYYPQTQCGNIFSPVYLCVLFGL